MNKMTTKTWTTLAGALALALAVVAAPAAFSQQDERPMGDQHQHMHHGQAGEMPEGHAEMMAEHQAKMAEHKAAMEEHMARMEQLMAEMNQATGDAKVDAVAAVLNEMWSQHQAMRESMGMMGGHGMMGAGCGCGMHAEGGGCPMMQGGTDDSQ